MFFYLIPLGLKLDKPVSGLLTWVLVALMVFRFVLSIFFEDMRLQVAAFLPLRELHPEIVAAVIQSLVSPVVFPGANPMEHVVFILLGVAATVIFWLGFGGGVEAVMGRQGFFALFLAGAFCGGLLTWFDEEVALTGVFWLGHASTMFAIGASCALFYAHDIRVGWFTWFPWGGGGGGVLLVPAVFLLVPALLLVMIPQSTLWYEKRTVTGLLVQHGPLTPLSWNLLLAVGGAAFALAWTEIGKLMRGERPKEEPMEIGRRRRPWSA